MKKFIGDKAFYKTVLAIAIPIMIQNGITNFVGLLDNIMVGQVGTEPMSGVAIVNTILFVFYLAVFGAISGPGIFTAQYAGQKNQEGIRDTFRFKILIVAVITLLGILLLTVFDDELILLFLHENGDTALSLENTLNYGKAYLHVMLIGMIPNGITQAYAGTLRETGETKIPMYASVIAVFVNLVLNYILIFGHFGFPTLGVVGAAVATVISRFVEIAIVVGWTHMHLDRYPYAASLYKSFKIPGNLAGKILVKGTPLFLNEFLWSLAMSSLTQCYSVRGLEVVAAFNISNTITNLFNVVMISMGSVVAIMSGQILGSGNMEEVVDTDNKLIAFSLFLCSVMAGILIVAAPLFPMLYDTTDEIRALAVRLMRIAAAFMPLASYMNTAYFTLRSGGKTFVTFLFDSVFVWVVSFPVAFYISRFTGIPIEPMYTIVLAVDFIKVIIGFILLKKRIWIQDLVG